MPSFFRRINRAYLALFALLIIALYFTSRVLLRFRDESRDKAPIPAKSLKTGGKLTLQQALQLNGLSALQHLRVLEWQQREGKQQRLYMLLALPESDLAELMQQKYWRSSTLTNLQGSEQLRQGLHGLSRQSSHFDRQFGEFKLEGYQRGLLLLTGNKQGTTRLLWLIDSTQQMRGILLWQPQY